MKSAIKKVSCLLGIILLSACTAQQYSDKVTRLNDPSDIKVTDVRSMSVNGLLNAAATLQNTSSSVENFQYRFRWTSATGFAPGSDEAWQPRAINPGESIQVRGTAPSPSATDFNLELSE